MKIKILLSTLFIVFSAALFAQNSHSLLRKADTNYDKGNYAMAEEQYRKANEKESTINGYYNLGVTTFDQDRYEESIEAYESSINKTNDPLLKSQVFFNLGNAYLAQQETEKAIDAYKEAIKLNPSDDDARKNLYLAKIMRQEEQKQEQKKKCDNPKPSDEEGEKDEEQEKDEQQEQNEEGEDESQGKESDSTEKEEPSENKAGELGEEQNISKEDALKLLQVIEDEEKKVQEKLHKYSGKKSKSDKDW